MKVLLLLCFLLLFLVKVNSQSPLKVSISQNGLQSLLVSWTSRAPTVTGYVVHCQQQDGGETERLLFTVISTATSLTITGLTAGETYSVGVVAIYNILPSMETTATYDITMGMYSKTSK